MWPECALAFLTASRWSEDIRSTLNWPYSMDSVLEG